VHRTHTPSRDRDWIIPVTAIVAVEAILFAILFVSGKTPAPLLLANSMVAFVALSIYAIMSLVWTIFRLMAAGEPEPGRRLLEIARQAPPRIVAVIVGVELAAISAALFSALKAAIPNVVPFWADGPVASLERTAIGEDAWRLAQHLFGWAMSLFDTLYLLWFPIQLVALYAVMTLRPSTKKAQALVSYFVLWLAVGLFAATAFSSAGPIFYDRIFGSQVFADLRPSLASLNANGVLAASDRLWSAHEGLSHSVGAGISAMPSLHVACAVWLALIVRALMPRLQVLGWTYAVLIWIGSVILGWHYALDGPAGAIGAILVWCWTPKLIRLFQWVPAGRSRTPETAPAG
jgi:hypothetical protein